MTFGSTSVMRFKPTVVANPSPPARPRHQGLIGTHVLLSNAASPTSSGQPLEWDRYLPTQVTLTRAQHDT